MATTSELQTTGVGIFLGNGDERTKKGRLGRGRTEYQKMTDLRSVTENPGISSVMISLLLSRYT